MKTNVILWMIILSLVMIRCKNETKKHDQDTMRHMDHSVKAVNGKIISIEKIADSEFSSLVVIDSDSTQLKLVYPTNTLDPNLKVESNIHYGYLENTEFKGTLSGTFNLLINLPDSLKSGQGFVYDIPIMMNTKGNAACTIGSFVSNNNLVRHPSSKTNENYVTHGVIMHPEDKKPEFYIGYYKCDDVEYNRLNSQVKNGNITQFTPWGFDDNRKVHPNLEIYYHEDLNNCAPIRETTCTN